MDGEMREAIVTFIGDRYLTPLSPALENETPLFSEGMIDSFGVLELIAFLEDRFHIQIDTSQHEIREFDSLTKIMDLVRTLKNKTA